MTVDTYEEVRTSVKSECEEPKDFTVKVYNRNEIIIVYARNGLGPWCPMMMFADEAVFVGQCTKVLDLNDGIGKKKG